MSSTFDKVTDITSNYEVVRAGIGAFVGTIISIILIIISVMMLLNKSKRTAETTATISKSTCTHTYDGNNLNYICQMAITYIVDGKNYNANINSESATQYSTNETIQVQYDPNNPQDVNLKELSSSTLAIILIVVAIVIILFGWGFFYLVRRNKGLAAVLGTSSIIKSI